MLAEQLAQAVEIAGMEARLRTVPSVSADHEATAESIPENGDLYCTQEDLANGMPAVDAAERALDYYARATDAARGAWDRAGRIYTYLHIYIYIYNI